MSDSIDLLGTVRSLLSLLWGVLGYVLRFLWLLVLPKAVLVAKLMALEAQLASCLDAVTRKKAPKTTTTLSGHIRGSMERLRFRTASRIR